MNKFQSLTILKANAQTTTEMAAIIETITKGCTEILVLILLLTLFFDRLSNFENFIISDKIQI
jgi:hypothetical protein